MKITRRGLLLSAGIVGGGLLVGVIGVGGYIASYDDLGQQRAFMQGSAVKMVAQFITITPDNVVTVIAPTTEMGQGSQTSILQIVLDELDADPERTRFELAPADPAFNTHDTMASFLLGAETQEGVVGTFLEQLVARGTQLLDVQTTGGSTGTRGTGWRGVRRGAALARMRLAEVGADRLGVPTSEVITRDSHVVHEASGRSVPYGELADAVAGLPLPASPVFKDPSTYRYIGTRHPRFDLPEKVFGKPVYGMDVAVDGMRYAAVVPVPVRERTGARRAQRGRGQGSPRHRGGRRHGGWRCRRGGQPLAGGAGRAGSGHRGDASRRRTARSGRASGRTVGCHRAGVLHARLHRKRVARGQRRDLGDLHDALLCPRPHGAAQLYRVGRRRQGARRHGQPGPSRHPQGRVAGAGPVLRRCGFAHEDDGRWLRTPRGVLAR